MGCPTPTLASIAEQIFAPTCAATDCHAAGGTNAAGLDLSLPIDELRARLAQPSGQSPSRLKLIEPGQIGQSYLYLKAFLPQPVVGDRMPPVGEPLTACQVEAIKTWIQAGATE